jgi:hypothetical protein
MGAVTAREGKMGMPWTQVGFQSDRQSGFLHTFVKLKEMRMTLTNSDPDYFNRSFRRKCSNPFHGKKKRAKLNCAQFFAQRKIDVLGNVGKKTERKMSLIAGGPANASNARIEIDQNVTHRFRGIDRDEETTQFHFRGRMSAPGFASSPLWLTRGGNQRLKILIARAIKFGNTALAAIIRYAEKGITSVGLPRRQAARIFLAARWAEIEANGSLLARSNHLYSAE